MDLTQFFLIAPVLTLQPPFRAEDMRAARGIVLEQTKITQFNLQLTHTVGNIIAAAKEGKTQYYFPHSFIEQQMNQFPENAYELLLQKFQQIFPDAKIQDLKQIVPNHPSHREQRAPGVPHQNVHEMRGILLDWSVASSSS